VDVLQAERSISFANLLIIKSGMDHPDQQANWAFLSIFTYTYLITGLNNNEVVVPTKAPPKTSLG
jgi:hypothetical protein